MISLTFIAHVWSRGSIFRPLRQTGPVFWQELADCPLCSGFWIGFLGHAAYGFPCGTFPLDVIGIGAIVGTLNLALCGLIRRI